MRKRRKEAGRAEARERSRAPMQRFVPKADRRLRKIFSEIGVPGDGAFVPDRFQTEAVEAIENKDVMVSAPTGSGKTWIAVQAIRKVLDQGKRAWYASPLKALSNSKYHEFEDEFGRDNVGVLTGDRKENTQASVVVGTTEILRNQLYDSMSKTADFKADLVVLDEAHYLGDTDRGVVWEEVMIYLPSRVRLLMLSASVQNDREIAAWLSKIRSHPCQVVHSDERPVPIYPLYLLPGGELVPLSGLDGISRKIQSFVDSSRRQRFKRSQGAVPYDQIVRVLEKFNLLPAVFFLKSRSDCNSALLSCRRRSLPSGKRAGLRKRLDELLESYPFLSRHPQLLDTLNHGIGSHHGGQLPHWKIIIEKLMNEGHLDAIFSTSTVAAGVNFPARTVVLVQSDRFNGKEFVSLSATDLHQATGRAGRRGKDKVGFAVMVHGPFQDPHLIDDLLSKPPDPVNSQIKINFSMCLNLLLSRKPDEIRQLLDVSFARFQKMEAFHELEVTCNQKMERICAMITPDGCSDPREIIRSIEARRAAVKKLSRLKKSRARFEKACGGRPAERDGNETLEDVGKKISALERELGGLSCGRCSGYSLCHGKKGTDFRKQLFEAGRLTASLEGARNLLWNDFLRHLDFLKLEGFARPDGSLTDDGIWASKLRLDQPLIIAELIRKKVLETLSPELLSGIIAVFVNDKYRDIETDYSGAADRRPLLKAFGETKAAIGDLTALKEANGFSTPLLQFWPAAALYSWACGEMWEEVIKQTRVDEGDLAMIIFRTADNLRQIASLENTHPELSGKARQCIHMLLREPVVIPT